MALRTSHTESENGVAYFTYRVRKWHCVLHIPSQKMALRASHIESENGAACFTYWVRKWLYVLHILSQKMALCASHTETENGVVYCHILPGNLPFKFVPSWFCQLHFLLSSLNKKLHQSLACTVNQISAEDLFKWPWRFTGHYKLPSVFKVSRVGFNKVGSVRLRFQIFPVAANERSERIIFARVRLRARPCRYVNTIL